MLAFARRQILEPRNIDLNQSVTETLNLLEKVIGSNIEIKTILASALSLVRADPTQVEQVLVLRSPPLADHFATQIRVVARRAAVPAVALRI